jgi:hypothetical protein
MASLSYRDPVTKAWVPVSNIAGPTGPRGPTGPIGPTGPTGGGLDQATADGLYVGLTGDVLSGQLTVPDQVAGASGPLPPNVLASAGYVDEIVTISTTDPDPLVPPTRDGLLWVKVTP